MINDGGNWTTLVFNDLRYYASHPNARLDVPKEGNAGLDLRCVEDIVIPHFRAGEPLTRWNEWGTLVRVGSRPDWIVKVHTGIHLEIPTGWYGRIAERSSISAGKQTEPNGIPNPLGGIKLFGGVVDSSYRGEVIVAMGNLTATDQHFEAGTKIAQIIFERHAIIRELEQVDSLDDLSKTERGQGGFGSTGIK